MWQSARVSVIVPAYDEALLISRMLSRVPPFVDAVYVIDDRSRDGTAEAVLRCGDARVRLIRHAENRGVGAAIATGYAAALADGADVLVVMAADDQMDPADLPRLLRPVVEGNAQYAKGNRFMHPRRKEMPFLRRNAGRVLSALTRLATGLHVDDTQCGYTALAAGAARSLPLSELWPRYGYPNDLLGLLAARGFSVLDVPVRPVYADEESGVRAWHFFTVVWVIARRSWLSATRDSDYAEMARSMMRSVQRSACSRSKQPSSSLGRSSR
jgi:glycosyltransferase involved in cell wall biosynthesis